MFTDTWLDRDEGVIKQILKANGFVRSFFSSPCNTIVDKLSRTWVAICYPSGETAKISLNPFII